MGAYSTLRITRTAALQFLMVRILAAPDDVLGDLMDRFLSAQLHNCQIVADDDQENDNDILPR